MVSFLRHALHVCSRLGLTKGEHSAAWSLTDGVWWSVLGLLDAVKEGSEHLLGRGETAVGHEEDLHEVITERVGAG